MRINLFYTFVVVILLTRRSYVFKLKAYTKLYLVMWKEDIAGLIYSM